ncbi:MAG: SUMF1/EgtB/PvdO family nonheme iron enzyme [Acidobacteriota bacterium]
MRKYKFPFAAGTLLGAFLLFGTHRGVEYTSSDQFCDKACHVHPDATKQWIKSTHFSNKSGVVTHCVDCHLPAGGTDYYAQKVRLGAQDVYGKLFTDVTKIDWSSKRTLDRAKTFTFDSGCVKCHSNLFSVGLSKKGVDGHLHYQRHQDKMLCINCHLHSGHHRDQKQSEVDSLMADADQVDIQAFPVNVEGFKAYSERIPGSEVVFEMVPIEGGTFTMGSPASEPYRRSDEGPTRQIKVDSFWMGRVEVRWREYEVFLAQRGTKEKNHPRAGKDATTGPTPPYGSPDQGWGKGARPAITMSHHAATTYCEWLSSVTGRKYRLPTEAEWEYACRAGTTGAYFFEGDPSSFTLRSWTNRFFGVKTSPLSEYGWYEAVSAGRTHLPQETKANPWGLVNMIGNVREFCQDWYQANAYTAGDREVQNPRGPDSGSEHVVRGGSFKSDAADLRCAARDHTRQSAWLMTDPQSPKSVWWYSDCNDVGFRLVREYRPEDPMLVSRRENPSPELR